MKQRITFTQVNGLTERGKRRLQEWWKPKDGDHYYVCNSMQRITSSGKTYIWGAEMSSFDEESAKYCLPLLSIGQMLEFMFDAYSKLMMRGWIGRGFCDQLWFNIREELNKK